MNYNLKKSKTTEYHLFILIGLYYVDILLSTIIICLKEIYPKTEMQHKGNAV